VAERLKQIWIDSDGVLREEILPRKHWGILAAGGGSLYKEGAGARLTRKEVHALLNAPPGLGFEAASAAIGLSVNAALAGEAPGKVAALVRRFFRRPLRVPPQAWTRSSPAGPAK
jgi:hypothetical protein